MVVDAYRESSDQSLDEMFELSKVELRELSLWPPVWEVFEFELSLRFGSLLPWEVLRLSLFI